MTAVLALIGHQARLDCDLGESGFRLRGRGKNNSELSRIKNCPPLEIERQNKPTASMETYTNGMLTKVHNPCSSGPYSRRRGCLRNMCQQRQCLNPCFSGPCSRRAKFLKTYIPTYYRLIYTVFNFSTLKKMYLFCCKNTK